MYEIVLEKQLAKNIKMIGIKAEHVTYNTAAGNFVVIIPDEKGERVPLTLYDWDKEKGILYVIFHEIGLSTIKLGKLKKGDHVYAVAGPFGKSFPSKKYGKVVVIGGGVGVPAIYPVARQLKTDGNNIISIIGYRTKEMIILENEMKSVSDEMVVMTNDGSYGEKGFVTDYLQQIISEGQKIDMVFAVGPVPMMEAVSKITYNHKIKTIVSLNTVMVDATGMCGGCRVTVGGEVKFACVDGPEFDAHLVDFKELTSRASAYHKEEKGILEHKCHISPLIKEVLDERK